METNNTTPLEGIISLVRDHSHNHKPDISKRLIGGNNVEIVTELKATAVKIAEDKAELAKRIETLVNSALGSNAVTHVGVYPKEDAVELQIFVKL